MNEWLKVMLGEIERKKAEREVALEEQRSRAERPTPAADRSNAQSADTKTHGS